MPGNTCSPLAPCHDHGPENLIQMPVSPGRHPLRKHLSGSGLCYVCDNAATLTRAASVRIILWLYISQPAR